MMRRIAMMMLLGCAGVLPGCAGAPKNIDLPASYWDTPHGKIGLAMVTYPEATASREGPQGLLDLALNAYFSKHATAATRSANPEPFREEIFRRLTAGLSARGGEVVPIEGRVDLESLRMVKHGALEFPYDLTAIAERYGVAQIIFISVESYGTMRPYYGFLPVGDPLVFFRVGARMVNVRDHAILWRAAMEEDEGYAPILGEWDQPPDYPNLSQAMIRAVITATDFLDRRFFGER
jgi:hypothetical protein